MPRGVDLRKTVPALQIPVYFLAGKFDYTDATSLARDYFQQRQAPVKGFYEFDNSAHSPLLEEPQEGHRIREERRLGHNETSRASSRPAKKGEPYGLDWRQGT